MEVVSAEPALDYQTAELAAVWEDLLRLGPRLKAVLPEELARVKERLAGLNPEGGHGRAADYELFCRVGFLLVARATEPPTMSQLSEALAVPMSTATRMVEFLVDSGYVERLPDLQDRRVVRVTLSPAGRDLYDTINVFMRQRVAQILERFSSEERQILVLLLRKVVGAIDEILGGANK